MIVEKITFLLFYNPLKNSVRESRKAGKSSGSYFFREGTDSLKSKMGSIEFCKLNFAFEGD